MYSYTYDETTGGLLLNLSPTGVSKEPRPVYAPEMDILGFDQYWEYDKQTDAPYMWAEANNYYYFGTLVAKLKGGNVYTAPEIQVPALACDTTLDKQEWKQVWIPAQTRSFHNVDFDGNGILCTYALPEPDGTPLRPVDLGAMVEANQDILEIIEQTTVKKIIQTYSKYRDKLDLFHVAFSGGKDSCVLLDLVKKSLPKGSYVVVFGDTGMEFPDTNEIVSITRRQCIEEDIPFYVAKSHLTPKESWAMFGPPSRTLRWCCSVLKGAPQTLRLREITGKADYSGLAFVGVRAHESAARAEYDYFNEGKKIRGQLSHNSILEWTSAEIWLYIYANDVPINAAYKKGNSRVGCLFCPMSVRKSDYIKQAVYPKELELYIGLIEKSSGRNFGVDSYISGGGWVSRRSGRDLIGNEVNYSEKIKNGILTITVTNPKTDWHEWIKTLADAEDIPFTVENKKDGYIVKLPERYLKENPVRGKLFKQVFRKSAYCLKCRVCQANCSAGRLKFDDTVHITDCTHCLQCHNIEGGCHAFHSLRIPVEEKNMSINCFDSVLPKTDWFERFFSERDGFWEMHGLGPNQLKTFKRFLRDAGLSEKKSVSPLTDLICSLGWETETAWGILLINLVASNPQIKWYITHLDVQEVYPRDTVISMLLESNSSQNIVKFVYSAFGKLVQLPLGTSLHWGFVTEAGELVRTKCTVSDPRVILYGLFKFAEECNDYKEFTLATLLNDSIDRDGISPTRIFGLNREDMIPILLGLSARYPEFISASFTHDLEKITLAEDRTSADVLALFEGDGQNA